ncbi:related to Nap1p-binding protein [Cephalotrichum gorgonifer]|uniref:Related to Nap1p-binding protein n=1 Tax=Cephalotrichum gorgonifer TaxID=2041049 RepID=A0AAE8N886_9PEZI|nr:related to Nap1p-binding protein [Cephalotrichum gorgonifer]
MSATSPTTTSPPPIPSPASSASHTALPPLITSPPNRRSTLPRPVSHLSKHRLSQYSTGSAPSRSRPPSHIFPVYPSSLPYTLVRDFAYPATHQLHYGTPPEPSRPPSGLTTPASEHRRLSDPSALSWEGKSGWDAGGWSYESSRNASGIAPIHLGDGPPWSEDEDLQSPVVSSRHRKHKSSGSFGRHHHHHHHHHHHRDESNALNPENYDTERGFYVSAGGNGGQGYYVAQDAEANGPGGQYVTYPTDQATHSASYPLDEQPRQFDQDGYGSDASSCSSPGHANEDQSRYSRDYQFTITSPDEEMHGKAVALYDFERESENELPLVEGQIILISYRHGEGWLVAQDPKTQESGLVPEAYVRLLRDIEGGMNSLSSVLGEGSTSPNDVSTPTQAEHSGHYGHTPTASNASNGYHQPVVSTFSTSSRDFDPYPTGALGAGQTPPQVVHYHGQRGGSQANTPTLLNYSDVGLARRGSADVAVRRGSEDVKSGGDATMSTVPETLQDTKLRMTETKDTDAMDTDR